MSWSVMNIMEPTMFFGLAELWAKSILLLALVWVAARIANHASASFRYTVWVTAFLGLIALPFLTQFGPKYQPIKPAQAERSTFTLNQPSVEVTPAPMQAELAPKTNGTAEKPSANKVMPQPNQVDVLDPIIPDSARGASLFKPMNLIIGVWLIGMLVITLWLARSYRMVHRLIAQSTPIDHAGLDGITKRIAAHYGLKSRIVLGESSHTSIPLACGLRRAFVLLPLSWRDWPADKLELVLMHECAHIIRRDIPIRALAYALLPIYWMNPLIWVAIRQLSWEQERACDDLVLGSGAKPSAYAKVLMAFADMGTSHRLITATQISDTTIKNRILSVLNPRIKRNPMKRIGAFAIMLSLSLVLGPIAAATLATPEAQASAYDKNGGKKGLESLIMGTGQPVYSSGEDRPITNENNRELSFTEFSKATAQLRNGSPEHAHAAANRLRFSQRPEAFEFLRVAIADYRPVTTLENGEKVRRYLTPGRSAARSLAEMNQFGLLHEALQSENPVVRGQAAYGLRFSNNSESIHALGLLLKDRVTPVRDMAIWALSHIQSPDAVKQLAPLSIDRDVTVCKRAITGIKNIHDATSAEALAGALSDTRQEVRFEALKALASLPGPKAVTSLGQALADPEPKIRMLAAKLLREAGDGSNIPALIRTLSDQNTKVRHNSVLALWKIQYKDGGISDAVVTKALRNLRSDPDQAVRLDVEAALAQIGVSDATLALRRRLLDPNPKTRLKTAFALAEKNDTSGRDVLIAALKDPKGKNRVRAAGALAKIRDKKTVSTLSQVLKEKQPILQMKAIGSLKHIGDPSVIPDLMLRLKDPDGRVRVAAIEALGSFKDLTATSQLRPMLSDSHAKVRAQAIVTLKDLRDLASKPALRKMLSDPNSHVRANAADALGVFKDEEAIPALINLYSDPKAKVRSIAVSALGEIGSPKAVAALNKALKDSNRVTRKNAAMALSRIPDPAAKNALIKAHKDPKKEVRIAALHALASLGDEASVQQVAMSLGDPDESVRKHAVKAIGLYKTELARQLLLKALDDESERIQFEAATILCQSGEARALPILKKMLKHPSNAVRGRAERSIKVFNHTARTQN